MAPQDDLTAERAAIIGQHYACEDSWYSCPLAEDGCANPGEGEECTCGVDTRRTLLDKLLKTTRQAALREAARVICPYCAAPDRWSAMNEYGDHESRETKPSRNGSLRPCSAQPILDRLASEGAPAPIDLLSKLKDDGGYGEHF